ncbi:MAG: OmpH family outer membrane protein [Saprospiraceae bacterium]
MIKTVQLLSITFIFLFLSSTSVTAQKFGHINSQKFIADLPAAKQIDQELVTYRDQLIAATNKLQEALDIKAKDFEAAYTEGRYSKKEAEERYAKLEGEQKEIFARRQEDEQKMLKKRESLYSPIFLRVDEVIKQVGKENGFDFIFDSSYYNAILYVESEDISTLVKAKLQE